MSGQAFDSLRVQVVGKRIENVDPASLRAGFRRTLVAERLQAQTNLILAGTRRRDPIFVTPDGAVADGHHGARAAIDLNVSVTVVVMDFEIEPGQPLVELLVERASA